MAYTDDIAISEDTREAVKYRQNKRLKNGVDASLQGKKYQQGQFMNVEGPIFKKVTHFKYLRHIKTRQWPENGN